MLSMLIARAKDRPVHEVPADGSDPADDSITTEWELARGRATSATELAEIDAIFGRYAA